MEFDDNLDKLKNIFQHKKGFYPTLDAFLNKCKSEFSKEEFKKFKDQFILWYNSQELVQVYSKPPILTTLNQKKGFYPKIISYYPFERLYVDSGSIVLFDSTRRQTLELDDGVLQIEDDKIINPPQILTQQEQKEEAKEIIQDIIQEQKKDDKKLPSSFTDKPPAYTGKYKEWIGLMKQAGKWTYYISRSKAKKLGLKDQDIRKPIPVLEEIIEKNLHNVK